MADTRSSAPAKSEKTVVELAPSQPWRPHHAVL